ncbi:MAG: hypothetical protein EA421_12790 [Gemmatimonadales bacterium]|nr:MAG: hypothetical protein EA421_12790 [Gemmatimonadales bacterium]
MGPICFSPSEDPLTPVSDGQPSGARLRFGSLEHQTLPNSRFQVEVTLHGRENQPFTGTAEGTNLAEGRMRAGAEATMQALASYLGSTLTLSFRGARTIRSFDSHVVVVALRAQSGERPQGQGEEPEDLSLIGCVAIPDRNLARGAALAVLNASNRILESPGAAFPPEPGDGTRDESRTGDP